MLRLIESTYSNSSNKIKLQLLILPLFLVYFYLYFYSTNNDNTPILSSNENLDVLVNKKFNKSYLELVNEIEKYITLKKIKVNSIDYKNKNLLIKGESSISKIKKLISKLESINNYSNINLLNISKTKKLNVYNFEIKTEFKKYYIKDKKDKTKDVVKKVRKTIKLKAIVSNHVLLNNKWHSLNEKMGKYIISEINTNSVVLTYKDKKLSLKLHKNE